jgi:tetratricopeptide (TPR) repeat protein
LSVLFDQLKKTQEMEKGKAITQEIWEVWYEITDENARDLFNKGIDSMSTADYHSALVAFTRLTELKPDFAEAWNRRATLLYLMGEFNLSMQDIKHTLELEPRHFGAISGLGQIYLRQDKLIQARKAFEKALDINPHLEGARINIRTINKLLSQNSI